MRVRFTVSYRTLDGTVGQVLFVVRSHIRALLTAASRKFQRKKEAGATQYPRRKEHAAPPEETWVVLPFAPTSERIRLPSLLNDIFGLNLALQATKAVFLLTSSCSRISAKPSPPTSSLGGRGLR